MTILKIGLERNNWMLLGFWFSLFCLIGQVKSQNLTDHAVVVVDSAFTQSEAHTEPLLQKVVITDAPGRKGKEFGDTTIYVNSELRLYAALYNNGKYKSEAKVDWFWADTSSLRPTPSDTSKYLGFGSSIIFKPSRIGAGFIFVKGLSNAIGDSTGAIQITTFEKLNISPACSDRHTITLGQQNIYVYFEAENLGDFPVMIQEANLRFLKEDSLPVSDQYFVHRVDTGAAIAPGIRHRFEFLVDVKTNADTGMVYIDAQLMTRDAFYQGIEPKHRWEVQTPPILQIDWIEALTEQVFPGQQDVFVVMHVSNLGGTSIGATIASLTFWRNGQDVSNQYHVEMSESNPPIIAGHSSAQLQLIVQVKPTASFGTVVINGSVLAQDINTGNWYGDNGTDRPGSWLVTQTMAQVGIISTRAICPNRDANGDGQVNLRQKFAIAVVVRNEGTDDVLGVTVTLRSDGKSKFLVSPSQVIPQLSRAQIDTLSFSLEAWADEIPSIEKLVARIDSAISISGTQVTISPAVDSLAQVTIFRPAHLILETDPRQVIVPSAGVFEVVATVNHLPESASFDGSGILDIHLPDNYELISGVSCRSFLPNEKVRWDIRAPATPSGPDTMTIFISQIPYDRNDPTQLAQMVSGEAIIVVNVLESSIEIADVAVIHPAGARDNIVSTEQLMLIRAVVTSKLVENTAAQIIAPHGFELLDDGLKPVIGDSVAWWLRAPNRPSQRPQSLMIRVLGNVVGDNGRTITKVDSSLSIQTVARANLKAVAQIIDPTSAIQGRISPGMAFTIEGNILNLGEAGVYGVQSLRLDLPNPRLFRLIGDTTVRITDQPARWTVQAADLLDPTPRIIKIWLHEIPLDENSEEEAWVTDENRAADLPVFMSTNAVQLLVRQLPDVHPKAIAPGVSENLMAIEFINLTSESGSPVSIQALQFHIEDNTGKRSDPATVINKLRVLDGQIIAGETVSVSDNPVEVWLKPPIELDANQRRKLVIQVDCTYQLVQSFRLHFNDTSSLAISSILPVTFVDELRNPITAFNLRSVCPVIVANDLKHSFRNYPNPFGTTDRSKTHFIYYLSQDSDIDLAIYTLAGELVWRSRFQRSQPQGRRGLHQGEDLTWDGRNMLGHRVLNGVYIARIATSHGEWALTRVAVIK